VVAAQVVAAQAEAVQVEAQLEVVPVVQVGVNTEVKGVLSQALKVCLPTRTAPNTVSLKSRGVKRTHRASEAIHMASLRAIREDIVVVVVVAAVAARDNVNTRVISIKEEAIKEEAEAAAEAIPTQAVRTKAKGPVKEEEEDTQARPSIGVVKVVINKGICVEVTIIVRARSSSSSLAITEIRYRKGKGAQKGIKIRFFFG